MDGKEFTQALDEQALTRAIREAEQHTSGEIRVFIENERMSEPLPAAQRRFQELHMHETRERNAVLIYVCPVSATFAILGDEGIDRCAGPSLWDQAAVTLRDAFKRNAFQTGLERAIEEVGQALARHFPRRDDDINELPDAPVIPSPS